jgi:hypothetical protein
MTDEGQERVGPPLVIAALVGLGLLGRRGRLALRRLKRLAGAGFATCVAGAFVAVLAMPAGDSRTLGGLLCVGWAIICGVFWCYVAFALWLTRDEEADGPKDK